MDAIFTNAVFSIVVLILSIIIHEVAHGYAAYALGDPTAKLAGRLTLNPLPHIDMMGSVILPGLMVLTSSPILFGWAKPVPYNPHNLKNKRWGEALVAVAGGATNIFIALVFAFFGKIALSFGYDTFASLAFVIAFVNLFLGMFNLIPLPPLDGYTVLRGILPLSLNYPMRQFEERVQAAGIFSLLAFLFIFSVFFAGPFYAFVKLVFGYLVSG